MYFCHQWHNFTFQIDTIIFIGILNSFSYSQRIKFMHFMFCKRFNSKFNPFSNISLKKAETLLQIPELYVLLFNNQRRKLLPISILSGINLNNKTPLLTYEFAQKTYTEYLNNVEIGFHKGFCRSHWLKCKIVWKICFVLWNNNNNNTVQSAMVF